jgi:putative ABC transport system permease protein
VSALRFALRLARRELREPRRHALLLAAVIGGVAALVAIRSFADNLQDSVRGQARALLGADVAMASAAPFSAAAEDTLQRIAAAGDGRAQVARVTSFGAMAFVEGRPGTRLVQVVAVDGGYPFYGTMNTEPAGQWPRLAAGGGVLVDPSLLLALDAKVGDTLALGEARFPIRGAVTNVPGDVSIRTAFGSRVFLAAKDVPATGLVGFGSRVRYESYVQLPPGVDAQRLADRHRPGLNRERVSIRTISEDQESINQSLGRLGRYLALVGLCALLLGGLGVASAAHALVRRRMDAIAALRCLGATARQLFLASLAQAVVMGLVGSLLGAALGVAAQAVLPRLVRAFLPVDVAFAPSWRAIATGVALGTWVAIAFSLRPLALIRRVSPLLVIRRDVEP